MPTALSLQIVMHELGETDNKALNKLTGLSEPQINRCKLLLEFPERFQSLSLDPNPSSRIPSNFWIEAKPVLDLTEELLPDITVQRDRDGLTDLLVEKYRARGVKSVLHFRKIMEAYELCENEDQLATFTNRLREYFQEVGLETRKAFDEFVVDNRRVQSALHSKAERPLHENSTILDPVTKDRLRKLCKEINPRGGLGFKNSATMAVLYNNSPNLVPSILRGSPNQRPCKGLVPRTTDLPAI